MTIIDLIRYSAQMPLDVGFILAVPSFPSLNGDVYRIRHLQCLDILGCHIAIYRFPNLLSSVMFMRYQKVRQCRVKVVAAAAEESGNDIPKRLTAPVATDALSGVPIGHALVAVRANWLLITFYFICVKFAIVFPRIICYTDHGFFDRAQCTRLDGRVRWAFFLSCILDDSIQGNPATCK